MILLITYEGTQATEREEEREKSEIRRKGE